MEQEELKGVVALLDQMEFMRRTINQKDVRIKYLEDLKGVTEKMAADKAFLKLHRELIEDYNNMKKAALTILELGLEFDYGHPELFAAIKVVRGED